MDFIETWRATRNARLHREAQILGFALVSVVEYQTSGKFTIAIFVAAREPIGECRAMLGAYLETRGTPGARKE